jgi:hypothetical protein
MVVAAIFSSFFWCWDLVVTLDTADDDAVAAVATVATATDASSDILEVPDVVGGSYKGHDIGDTHSGVSW